MDHASLERILLRPEEAAQALGISKAKLYTLIARGEIPALKIDRSRRVPVEGLREWIQRRTREA